jgi:predicted extracellular nuclease
MNEIAGENNYTYIKDGTNSTYTKVGFIYRKDKVTPYQSTISATTQYAYKMRLRIQAFKENSTNEKFVLSMNHFKAKVNSDDEGESQRNRNTSDVINKLKSLNYDPDILIMGDLNAYTYEDCIQTLISSGYDEMLVQYDSNAYSYIYQGDRCLLDHAMANSTMAEQVTGARVYHINTAGGYNYKYSDHDAVLVGLNLGMQQPGEGIQTVSTTVPARKVLRNGQLLIEIDGHFFTITGTKIQ